MGSGIIKLAFRMLNLYTSTLIPDQRCFLNMFLICPIANGAGGSRIEEMNTISSKPAGSYSLGWKPLFLMMIISG